MAKLTDDADYDAGEIFENVPSPLSNAGNHDNYYGRRLRTRCLPLSPPDNKINIPEQIRPYFTNDPHVRMRACHEVGKV
ncbi:unnamed protein product [Protopolystoma xenopodis]|uniref:Uncharacterized protein n=1 Tax=Protopolystoma xenopodis TaxID=117903 RepID=A0A3S5ALI1_9PLAT|nr:unnamed protein product [Protopolystoma xenopodis]